MPLTPRSRDRIRRDWGERLDCAPTAFEQQGVTLAAANDRTVRLLRRRDATVVSANTDVRDALEGRTRAVARWPLVDADGLLERALQGRSRHVVTAHAPVILAYVDASSFTPVESDARLLEEEEDSEAFEAFREQILAEEWARASPTYRPGRTAGLFRDGELVAAATLGDGPLPDVGVVVAPEYRDEGIGQAVVSRVLKAAFEADGGLVPRYRTPEKAEASSALAAALGFEQWASEAVVVLEE